MPIGHYQVGDVIQQLCQRIIGLGRLHAQEVVDLADRNDQRNAASEASNHRRGDEGDIAAQPKHAEQHQEDARQHARHPDSRQAIALRQHNQHRRHRAGGAADLVGCAAQPGDQDAGENGSDQTSGGGGPTRHAKGQG